jgi:hypothetical protein
MIPVILFWFPLVETGRWAWNPNLIPLWVTLSIIFYLKSSGLSRFLSGLFIGLSIHHHYLAVFAAVGLGIVVLVESIRGREIKKFVAYASGLFAAIVPFIVFDLRHPPGLFITRILYFNNLGAGEGGSIFEKLVFIIKNVFSYFSGGSIVLEKILIAFTSLLIIKDIGNIKKQGAALKFIGVFVLQVIALTLVADYYGHYILPVLPFFIVYLVYPRQGIGKVLSYTAIGVILLSLIISFPKQIDKVSWETDIASTRFITNTIEEEIINGDRKNSNIAVLESDDPNTYGRRYRDLLLIKGVVLKTKGEYEISDNLFVVTKSSLEKLREDPAYEIRNFRDGPIIKTWEVPESDWKIFLFSRSI